MLTDAQILSRRTNYRCCALDYLDKWVTAKVHGDTKCAEENWRMFMFLSWAADVMCDTPIGDETGCTERRFATGVAQRADCLCECPCPEPPEEEVDCAIVPDFTIVSIVSGDELPIPCSINLDFNEDFNNDFNADIPCVNVAPGESYYVTSGQFAGSVVTWEPEPDWNNDYSNAFNT